MLVATGPPPELSPALAEPPSVGEPAEVRFLPKRRREATLVLAAAIVALVFGIGYLVGNRGNQVPTSHLVSMHGVGTFASAKASVRIGDKDEYGNWPIDFSVSGLKKLGKGRWYELYLTKGGRPAAACGSFKTSGSVTEVHLSAPYKLTEYDGRPVLKLSAEKATAPGRKQIFRSADGDVLGLREETLEGEPLLESVMTAGRRTSKPASMEELRSRFDADLAALPAETRRLRDPAPRTAEHSVVLQSLTAQARSAALRRSGASSPA